MQDRIRGRLQELSQELETGQLRLRDLEMQQASVRETLLRISGAIQVLEEMLAQPDGAQPNGAQLPQRAQPVSPEPG